VCPAGPARAAARVVGAAGRLVLQLVRAPALALIAEAVRATDRAEAGLPELDPNLSVEPGGPEKQAIIAILHRCRFHAAAQPAEPGESADVEGEEWRMLRC
jgi:hypothetical protein